MEINESRNALLAHVASLYFDLNKTQQEIADSTGIARTMVSRMIAEARERGIVEITVHFPWTSKKMEKDLVEKFSLKAARVMVMDDGSQDDLLMGLGVLCADYFNSIIHDNMTIGITWGTAIQ